MRTSKKRYQVKKKKTILKNRIFWWVLLISAVAGGLFYLTVLAPFFQVKKVLVFGQDKITSEQILQTINPSLTKKTLFFESQSIFLIRTGSIKALVIKEFPAVEELKIKRLWPDSLSIEIKERQAIGAWCRDLDCFNVDKTGVIFETANPETETRIIIHSEQASEEVKLGEEAIEPKTLSLILDTQKHIAEKTNLAIKEFFLYENDGRLDAKSEESWQIYFDIKGDLNWQILGLELLLEKTLPQEKRRGLEYIDLRFNKVFYK